ncbi:MAG: KamA family radical SAM protein [Proteobacteria bacterium]|nr:KamA family radical SAM protein [Pseudomonadota bacterium]
MDTNDNAANLIPAEFLNLANNPQSLTAQTSQRFGVSPETFLNWRWHMKHQVMDARDAQAILQLQNTETEGFAQLQKLFNAGVTPYYMGLMLPKIDRDEPDCPIRLQALPRLEELHDSLGVADPLSEVPHSPVREVVHVYPDRVAFCVAQLCPVYCRYCYRKRRDEEVGLHFNRKIIADGIQYISNNPAIRDVLITGGDAFMASDQAIEQLLQKIRAIPHVEIIRFGTRTPVTLPYRVTANLAKILAKYHPVYVNTHFNCVEEITPEAALAVANLANAGISVGNQAVLLRGVNDSPERMMALCRGLLKIRARPYYVFHPHAVAGTEHLRVSVRRGLDVMKSLRGNITGMGIPNYIIDTPSGKIPINHNYVLGFDGDDLILETIRGEIWREKDVFN